MRILELFCCSGGLSEGFRRAGIPVTTAIDRDQDACDSYERNLGHRPIRMDVRDFARMLRDGWRPHPPIDLIVADPPCTPWSRAGKRAGLADPNDCLRVTVEIIRWLVPRAYLIGNVPRLQDEPNWWVVQDTVGRLVEVGYCVRDFTAIDAADLGVPQRRIRPWWFGHRGWPCLTWPARTHADPAEFGMLDRPLAGMEAEQLRPWVTCRQALGHLPADQIGRPIGAPLRGRSRNPHPESLCDRPARTLCVSDVKRGTMGAGVMAVRDWPWDRPSTTVLADERIPPPGHHEGNTYLSRGIKLSERAATILQGFPEAWTFCGTSKRARWAQIGMATPPPMAEAIARSVRAWFKAQRCAGTTEAA